MQFKKLCVTSALALGVGLAHASTIEIATGASSAGPLTNAAEYQAVVGAAVTQVAVVYSYDHVVPQEIFPGLGNGNFAFASTVSFGVSATNAGTWEIRSGVDFGRGGAIFVDGVAKDFKTTDMWWNGNYGDSSQYFDISVNLAAGNHVLKIYGLEGCCSGAQQAQFSLPTNAGFTSFSSTDGLIAAVPEPESYALMIAGLGLMGLIIRRRKPGQPSA